MNQFQIYRQFKARDAKRLCLSDYRDLTLLNGELNTIYKEFDPRSGRTLAGAPNTCKSNGSR